jgi:hypothetical protein
VNATETERRHATPPLELKRVLGDFGLLTAFYDRPVNEQNDYLSWIGRATLDDRDARIAVLLDDLASVGKGWIGGEHD